MKKNVTSLERLEEGLARSRAFIQKAIRYKNHTSLVKESFVPKTAIYRNPHAFHQLSMTHSDSVFFFSLSGLISQKYFFFASHCFTVFVSVVVTVNKSTKRTVFLRRLDPIFCVCATQRIKI